MAATPFVAISWEPHEVITKPQMDQTNANAQWILDNTPRGVYVPETGNPHDANIVIVSGRTNIPRNKYAQNAQATVKFGSTFSPNYPVHITTGVMSSQRKEVFRNVRGIDNSLSPDHRGFIAQIIVKDIATRPAKVRGKAQKDKPDRAILIAWMATGIRRA